MGQSLDSIRQIARNGEFQNARELCQNRNDYPDNTDLVFLSGQTYFWEKDYSNAKKTFLKVLEDVPNHPDALASLSSVFLATQEYDATIEFASRGLNLVPDNESLLYNRAYAFANIVLLKEARSDIEHLLSVSPNNKKALELKESLENYKIPGSIRVMHSLQWFNDLYERRFYTTIAEAPIGDQNLKIIPRLSIGNLSSGDTTFAGSQAGLDFYPLLGPSSYLYVNYAYSESDVFPSHRSALEWFHTLSKGWEISSGGRYLYWDSHLFFFTLSASRYMGKWNPGIRLFFTPDSENSLAAIASLRRNLKAPNNYIHFFAGYGTNPDRMDRQFDLSAQQKSQRISTGAYAILKIGGPIYGRIKGEYTIEEHLAGKYRDIFLAQIGLEYIF
jgi:YaiO family outer membrane protein